MSQSNLMEKRLYKYTVKWSESDQQYVGLCANFPSLSWLDDTKEGAEEGIKKLVLSVVENIKDENSNDIYAIAARVKNLARGNDASLTPVGEKMCNYYILVLKDLYDFADKLEQPIKDELLNILKNHENMPAKLIESTRKKKPNY